MTTPQPPHPVHALTSKELADYRRQLEHAITGIDPTAPVQALLHRNLDQVLAEQAARADITATGGYAGPAPAAPAAAIRPAPQSAPGTFASPRDDLTPRVFRALYETFDLHIVGGAHIAVPTGTPCFGAASLSEIARQISTCEHPEPTVPPEPSGPLDRRPAR